MNLQAILGLSAVSESLWSESLTMTCAVYEINSPLRLAAFLAQVAHESGVFNSIEENLRYSENGLKATFPKYFKASEFAAFAHRPEKIANRVYASRMGNGDEASGDGWKFHGRGLIQLTGRSNYEDCGLGLGIGLVDSPDLLLIPVYAARSAGWFWKSRKLNSVLDKQGFEAVTKVINGGLNGQEHRVALFERAKSALGVC